jgi:hypothetical protein
MIRSDGVNAMLLNEFPKEQKAVVEEQHKVQKLEATVADLVETVKEHTTQIHRVSAEIQMQKARTQSVAKKE